jgi:hypothetical protein
VGYKCDVTILSGKLTALQSDAVPTNYWADISKPLLAYKAIHVIANTTEQPQQLQVVSVSWLSKKGTTSSTQSGQSQATESGQFQALSKNAGSYYRN